MTAFRRPAVLLALLLAVAAGPAAATAEWRVQAADGLVLTIAQDPRSREGYVLERRHADGRSDTRFGDGGATPFSLGPDNEGPAALALDARGRAWVAGASQGSDGLQRAVLLRFAPDGRPDRGFATNGRSAVAPAGREARATDVLPLDDGSAIVAGIVVDAQGDERSGVWRVRNDGTLDLRFGLGGLWADAGRGATDLGGLARSPDGTFAVGVRRADGARTVLETWTWRDDGPPQRAGELAVDARRLNGSRLSWRDGRWQWGDADPGPSPAPAPAPAVEAVREPAAAALVTPFANPSPQAAASAPGTAPADSAALGWWLLLPAGLAAMWWWRRSAGTST